MKKDKTKQIEKLKKLGPFNLETAIKKTGVAKSTILKWVAEGKLQRPERGLYLHPESKVEPQYEEFVTACEFFGKDSAIGGLTALFYYGLIEQVPHQIWMVVTPEHRTTMNKYRLIRTKTNPKIGIDKINGFRLTSIERTLIESLKHSPKIGVRTVIGAIRRAIKERKTTEVKIGKMARELGMWSTLGKYWETFVE